MPVCQVLIAWPWLWVDNGVGDCFVLLRWSPGGLMLRWVAAQSCVQLGTKMGEVKKLLSKGNH